LAAYYLLGSQLLLQRKYSLLELLMSCRVTDTDTGARQPIVRSTSFIGWPDAFGGNCRHGWTFVQKLGDRLSALQQDSAAKWHRAFAALNLLSFIRSFTCVFPSPFESPNEWDATLGTITDQVMPNMTVAPMFFIPPSGVTSYSDHIDEIVDILEDHALFGEFLWKDPKGVRVSYQHEIWRISVLLGAQFMKDNNFRFSIPREFDDRLI
jgi:hypothetical protein